MKVLIAHSSGRKSLYGGAEHVIVNLCNYLRRQNIKHALIMNNIPGQMRNYLKDTRIYSQIPFVHRYDIINYHNFPATLDSVYNYGFGLREVWYCNEPAELFTNWQRKPVEWLNRKLVKNKIKNVIVADKFNARRAFDIYGVVPRIIPYGIDYEFFSQCERNPDPDYFTVLQVGTISHFKNQLATIQAVGELKDRMPDIRLILVGHVSEPEYKAKVEELIRDYGLGGRVSWEPHVSREHLRYLYSKADILVHPVKEQGGWLTPFEAISAGVPVIVSEELTCSDMINQYCLGNVTDNFTQAIYDESFWSGTDEGINHTVKCREWVKDNLTWDKFGESMVKCFEDIIRYGSTEPQSIRIDLSNRKEIH